MWEQLGQINEHKNINVNSFLCVFCAVCNIEAVKELIW